MLTTKVYGRIKLDMPDYTTRAEIITPGGETQPLWLYNHYDSDFTYDRHGYETVSLRGNPRKQAAYTATQEGRHILRAYNNDGELLEETMIDCNSIDNGGFVEVSRRDPRYFILSDGSSYIPVGPNLVGGSYTRLPAGREHFKSSTQTATTGLIEWKRWFRAMKAAGANYTRIWLSNRYTQARTGIMGVHDPVALARFDALIESARENGIRLKLCLGFIR